MFSGHGLEWFGSDVGPWEQFVEGAVEMSVDDPGQHVGQIGVGFDAAKLAILDQCGDYGPVVSPAVRTREERIFAIESKRPD